MNPFVLRIVHVSANLVWIGSILAAALLLSQGAGNAETRGQNGLLIYRRLAVPAFVISFTLGVLQLTADLPYYFKTTHFMHGKLALVAIVIGIHHVIGARAKAMAAGKSSEASPVGIYAGVLAVAALATVFLVIAKPF